MATEIRDAPAAPTGLTNAQVADRVARGAVNVLPEGPSRSTADIVKANLVTRFNLLLGVLLLIILVAVREPRDALFGIVLVTNAAIGITQELRAKATLDRLAVLTSPTIRVIREGTTRQIAIDEVVTDDLIVVGSGEQLPVDGTVLDSQGLEIDESLLTGESDPIVKASGDAALSGSFVVAGSGLYRADRVGVKAYAAALATEAKKFTLVHSELRDGIDWVLAAISWAVGPVIILLVISQRNAGFELLESLRSAVAAAVGMVPQGLVLLTSIAFAVGVIRLGRRNVLVQELPAIEGLARVDVICFDKTGTLTEGRLVVHAVEELSPGVDVAAPLGALAIAEADPNATLRAIGATFPPPDQAWPADRTVPFSSARKWSGASYRGQGTWALGAPEILAPHDGRVAGSVEAHAANGRRVVLLARSEHALSGERVPPDLVPTALVILGDRIRDDAAETLRYFADQGVRAKVISGDHPKTVGAIAREVGVPGSGDVVDARTLPDDEEELADVLEESSVFGRVSPHQKRAMVGALQGRGHVVAMTGDGVNDVLALKDSDIGIAVGSGSSASRAVAQLVLIDGSFATIPGVVAEGRRVISNIERVANLFVTKTVYAVFLAIAIGVAGQAFPFLPRHLTLVGSVTIGIPAFFLALAPNARRAQPGFVKRVARFSLPTGIAAGVATFAAYQIALGEDVPLTEARTTATLVLSALGLFALGIVSRPLIAWKKGLLWAMSALLLVLLLFGPSQDFFELQIPRVVVLMAAVGVVAITGTVMVGTLRGVGWLRMMPQYLREHPPQAERTWRELRTRIRGFIDAEERFGWQRGDLDHKPVATPAPATDRYRTEEPEDEPDPESAPDRPPGPVDWFDPDDEFLFGDPDSREDDPLADIEPFDPREQQG